MKRRLDDHKTKAFLGSLHSDGDGRYLDSMATMVFLVEFKMAKTIGPRYPFLKFWNQWMSLKEYYEEQKRLSKQ